MAFRKVQTENTLGRCVLQIDKQLELGFQEHSTENRYSNFRRERRRRKDTAQSFFFFLDSEQVPSPAAGSNLDPA